MVDLASLSKEMDAETEAIKAEGTASTTSAGGFSLLDGIDADLDKGSGKSWIPEEVGQTLIGMVEGVDEIQSDYPDQKTGVFKMVPLLDIRDESGELWSVRGYGAALSSQIAKAKPAVGDGIAIRFLGMEQPKNASYQPYKNWVVRVRRA